MSKAADVCLAATCEFEIAVMVFVLLSWIYTILIYSNMQPFTTFWYIWVVMFLGSIFWLFKTRKEMKEAQVKLCK